MSLADDMDGLDAYPKAEEPEYQPRTEFDGSSGFIQTGPLKEQPKDFTELLVQFGYDPNEVRIVGHPRTSRWQQRSQKRNQHGQRTGEYETVWLCAYRFPLAPITGSGAPVDLEAVVKRSRKARVPLGAEQADYWYVFQASDMQLGKRSRDGSTEQIVERYIQSVEAAKAELKACKRLGIAGVQISMPGDCLEGNQSQHGKNLWLTQETITEQTRILRRLMLYTIDAFTGANQVYLDVINGNHDEAQRQQNTYPGDGWATEAAIAVHDAIQLNPAAYSHVEVRVPDKWSGMMTVPVGDTVVTVAHGHQWRQENNAWKWWAEQAVNNQPAGGAHLLQSGHFHTWRVTSSGCKTHVQSSTFDAGSDWYRNIHGSTSRRGAVVYLLKTGEVSRMSVL